MSCDVMFAVSLRGNVESVAGGASLYSLYWVWQQLCRSSLHVERDQASIKTRSPLIKALPRL